MNCWGYTRKKCYVRFRGSGFKGSEVQGSKVQKFRGSRVKVGSGFKIQGSWFGGFARFHLLILKPDFACKLLLVKLSGRSSSLF